MNKHTPTPWRVNEQLQLICVENGYRIGLVNTPHPQSRGKERREDWEYCKANAAHIVLCVNSHDALVEALQSIEGMYDHEKSTGELSSLLYEAKTLARIALAAAGAPQ